MPKPSETLLFLLELSNRNLRLIKVYVYIEKLQKPKDILFPKQ